MMASRYILLLALISCSLCHPLVEDSDSDASEPVGNSRQSSVRVLDPSSAAELEREATANASLALSNTSLEDIESDNVTHTLQLRYRERKKQERLTVIQAQILRRLRMGRHPNVTAPKFSEAEQQRYDSLLQRLNARLRRPAPPHPASTMQRLQSFYPACTLPNHMDKHQWETPGSFRIFYSVPLDSGESELGIVTARLRLFKMTGNADPSFVGWHEGPRHNLLGSLVNAEAANAINVYVYQYIKPLRPNKKEKKRLVDTRTLSLDYEGWTEFNVATPLQSWLGGRNFGLDVEVEDAFGNRLDPNLHFRSINCSAETARDSPFPNVEELDSELFENESSLFENETFPTLDLQTVENTEHLEFPDFPDRRTDERSSRKKRSDQRRSRCAEETVYVSFAEMELGKYILWPEGVHWTFCDVTNETSPERTSESVVERWIRRHMEKMDKPNSPCHVSRRENLPLIFNHGNVTLTILKNLVPTACSCGTT